MPKNFSDITPLAPKKEEGCLGAEESKSNVGGGEGKMSRR
jgi:hypothetical protein